MQKRVLDVGFPGIDRMFLLSSGLNLFSYSNWSKRCYSTSTNAILCFFCAALYNLIDLRYQLKVRQNSLSCFEENQSSFV